MLLGHRRNQFPAIVAFDARVASILVGEIWYTVGQGGFVFIPRSVMHDFRNESDAPIRLLNVFLGGPFEVMMPSIAAWFADNPPKPIP